MKAHLLAMLASALMLAGIPGMAGADVLVDRGLPTINLNNAAGADRSNVAWVDAGYTPANYQMIGDSFANTSSQTWSINTVRLWTVGTTTSTVLWGGIDGSTIGVVAGTGAISNTTYADLSNYQNTSGTFSNINQVDFSVNLTLAPGQTYDFFLDGSGGNYVIPFVHASNAALSGSPQAGADNLMLEATVVGGSVTSVSSFTSLGNGWDKASDVNVQVIGVAAVPEPGTYALMLAGLGLLGFTQGRKKRDGGAA